MFSSILEEFVFKHILFLYAFEIQLEFLIDLLALNIGNRAIFVNKISEEVIDISYCTETIIDEIQEWHISDTHSFSDHRYIVFKLGRPPPNPIDFRNKAKANLSKFEHKLRSRLDTPCNLDRTPEGIDSEVTKITNSLTEFFEESCPLRERKSNHDKPCMTGEIRNRDKHARRLYNRPKRKKSEIYWNDYELGEYNKIIRKAKRNS